MRQRIIRLDACNCVADTKSFVLLYVSAARVFKMSKHDPDNTRHSRVFELLRQTDTAIAATQACEGLDIAPTPKPDFDQIKAVALQSFGKVRLASSAAKSGSNDEFL